MLEKTQEYLNTVFAQNIINEQEFFFQKGQDALNKWLTYPADAALEKELLELASDYEGIQKRAKESTQINDILKLLFEITSYCDTKAKDKNLFNQYNDKRTLAMAYVRMNHWIEKLILFKLNKALVPSGSLLNAFNYLLDPDNNATILSENHREMISKKVLGKAYNPTNFIEELKDYFSEFGLTTANPNNYTYLLSCIIYFIKKDWLDDIIGLMASDNTEWKDDLINDMDEEYCAILWNSKRPTGTNDTIKMLRNKINNGEYFKLFYSVHGNVQYVAEIIDFVENEDQYKSKNWTSKFNKIAWVKNNYKDYADGNKSASIVFLARKFDKINAISTNKFEVYKNYSYPTQDNLTPIVSEPDMTVIPPTIISIDSKMKVENNNNKYPLNQILFGPPGTGKTHKLLNEYYTYFEVADKTINKEEFELGIITKLNWWQIITLVLLEEVNAKVPDIKKHRFIQYKLQVSNTKSLNQTAWGQLSSHTIKESHTVNYTRRIDPLIFDKTTDSTWQIVETKKELIDDLIEISEIIKNYKESTSKLINYKFITFHQSFSYEDFIEGIKPVMDEDSQEENSDVAYTIEKGIFYQSCNEAAKLAGFLGLKDAINNYTKQERANKFKNALPYGLFIDEINRGNVSQIFGELITLIEDDKRLGNSEIILDLPYSKEKFGVPPNLHIIGTMNTADRSVEALDTALRRRFSFEEMSPKYDLKELQGQVYGFVLYEILATLNKRIVRLLNNDHAIGHSYFLNKDEDTIIESFNRNIIPLLQEYFFGDYGKMMLVLGDGFVTYDEWKDEEKFFASYSDAKNDYDVKDLYFIQDYSNNKQGFAEALKKLMNK
jgi:5-methylcytosine-specific restriction protein B